MAVINAELILIVLIVVFKNNIDRIPLILIVLGISIDSIKNCIEILLVMSTNDDYVYDYNGIDHAEIFNFVISFISAFIPASVVFILLQRYDLLVRGKSLIHYVLMIAIADTFISIASTFGFPEPGILCSTQSFSLIFFSRMSWSFTFVLVFQLCYIVLFKKYYLNIKYMHIIVWTFTLLLTFLPFSTGTFYGRSATEPVVNRCVFYNPNGDVEYANDWKQYTYRIELLIFFSVMIVLSALVIIYSRYVNDNKTSNVYLAQRIRESWSTVILYPAAMLITWVPSIIWGFHGDFLTSTAVKVTTKHYYVIADYLNACQALYGPLLALIYYSKKQDARRAWIHNFRRLYHFITEADSEEEKEDKEERYSSSHDVELVITSTFTSKIKLDDNNNQIKSPLQRDNNEAKRIEEL